MDLTVGRRNLCGFLAGLRTSILAPHSECQRGCAIRNADPSVAQRGVFVASHVGSGGCDNSQVIAQIKTSEEKMVAAHQPEPTPKNLPFLAMSREDS